MAEYNLPEPRAPDFEKPTSVEECLPQARKLAEQEHGRAALGPVQEGERILIATLPDQNKYVQKAITQALEEKGAETVDFVYIDELIDGDLDTYSAEDGWREAEMLKEGKASTARTNADLATGVVTDELVNYVEENEYTSIHTDVGQRTQKTETFGEKFKGNWLFNNWEEFVSGVWTSPEELVKEIERKAIEPLGKASEVRITDPEGTHLEYSLSAEEAKRWQNGAFKSGHLYFNPYQATAEDPGVPTIPKVDGVLAGTSNHTGYFPHIELHFKEGRLVDVEGGGKYGELIADLMEEYADIQWPGYPDKGLFWFVDTALCTLIKAFRRTSDLFDSYWQYPNITERNRNGVFHLGFGSASKTHTEEMKKYAKENDIPTGHIHVHNYFTTFEVKLRDSGEWHKIVDKGRITAMDDPEIRALASEYGDSDELLSYDWEPPLPGINCEGDYHADYAPDPAKYLKERMNNGDPI